MNKIKLGDKINFIQNQVYKFKFKNKLKKTCTFVLKKLFYFIISVKFFKLLSDSIIFIYYFTT